jgi:hypothetical protein
MKYSFTARHEVRIRKTNIVEEIGQNGKADFFFDVRNAVPGFDDEHRHIHARN